ncbi:hypothetical protein HMPREF9074_07406 [Capnocytophaga sp. oral taxon 329 str. F0087]|nr:hypothetical protein HMPREF9074_07406 [Capnocytophaga sp. oral taxon 329 str. F0087]
MYFAYKNDSFLLYCYKQQGFDTRYIFNNQHLIIKHPPIHILRCASSRTSFKGELGSYNFTLN